MKSIKMLVLDEFNRQDINYAIMRNYDDLSDAQDLDVLVSEFDLEKVSHLMKGLGLTVGNLVTNLIDIKCCSDYDGYYFASNDTFIKDAKIFKGYKVLSETDELFFLLIKSIHSRKYNTRIKKLLEKVNINDVMYLWGYFKPLNKNPWRKILYWLHRIQYPYKKRDLEFSKEFIE